MTFQEALKKLDIEDYSDRILNSNSQGELFHLMDYTCLAQMEGDLSWFRTLFEAIVKWAEKTWKRPESVFQHIPECLEIVFETSKQRNKQESKT